MNVTGKVHIARSASLSVSNMVKVLDHCLNNYEPLFIHLVAHKLIAYIK